MKDALKLHALSAAVLLATALLVTGCKSAPPPLTVDQAQAMIQAKYDQAAPVGISINLSDLGMGQGMAAGYWVRTKVYPNRYWADFTLTPEGKKLVTLPGGGNVIQWRPMSPADSTYSMTVTTVQANRLKALNVQNIQSESLPDGSKGMGAHFDEVEDFTGIPAPLSDIGHNPGNQVSVARHADFALVNGAWKLQSIE